MLIPAGPFAAATSQTTSFAADWGQLLGVVAGVILGGIAQMIAGVVQRRHEQQRENRETKRTAYTEFLQVLDDFEFTIMRFERRIKDQTAGMGDFDEFTTAMHGFNAALVAVQVNGSKIARDIAEKIREEIGRHSDDWREHDLIAVVHKLEVKLISEVRRDLNVRG